MHHQKKCRPPKRVDDTFQICGLVRSKKDFCDGVAIAVAKATNRVTADLGSQKRRLAAKKIPARFFGQVCFLELVGGLEPPTC